MNIREFAQFPAFIPVLPHPFPVLYGFPEGAFDFGFHVIRNSGARVVERVSLRPKLDAHGRRVLREYV